MVTPCLTTVRSASDSGQLPPVMPPIASAPLPAAMSTITEPGFIDLTMSSVISVGAAGNERGADHDVGQRDALGDLDLLAGQPARGHRLGVAADADRGFLLLV